MRTGHICNWGRCVTLCSRFVRACACNRTPSLGRAYGCNNANRTQSRWGTRTAMPTACRVWVDAEGVRVSLKSPCGQSINLNRKIEEPIGACLKRFCASVHKAEAKAGAATAAGRPADAPTVELMAPHGRAVPPDTRNDEAWQHGGQLSITLPGWSAPAIWAIEMNPPYVASLMLPELAIVGHPVVALADLRFANGATWEWSTTDEPTVVLGRASTYLPATTDVARTLQVAVTPACGDTVGDAMSSSCAHAVVELDPAILAPLESRASSLPPSPAAGLRVVSYNVLWGVSAESAAKKGGRRASAPPAAPTRPIRTLAELPVSIYAAAYRQHVLAHELLAYCPDVRRAVRAGAPTQHRALHDRPRAPMAHALDAHPCDGAHL